MTQTDLDQLKVLLPTLEPHEYLRDGWVVYFPNYDQLHICIENGTVLFWDVYDGDCRIAGDDYGIRSLLEWLKVQDYA